MKMPQDLFELSKNFPRREDMKLCDPHISDYYNTEEDVYRFRPKTKTKAVAIPNLVQERISRHLDAHADEITAWLDSDANRHIYGLSGIDSYYLLKIPFLHEEKKYDLWTKEAKAFDPKVTIRDLTICLRRCTLIIKREQAYLWSYAAVTDYGHIILGKIRQRFLRTSVITEQGMRLGD